MEHIFERGTNSTTPTFLLLHSLGGTERDLIPLAKKLNPEASVLSVRGKNVDNGKRVFCRRSAEGVLDEADVIYQTNELYEFLTEAANKYTFDRENVVALGLTDGAHIAASLLFHYTDALQGAILYHPIVPRRGIPLPDLTGTSVFIGASKNNPICPQEETIELEQLLKNANADVTLHWENSVNYLTGEIFAASRAWYESTYLNTI